MAGEGVTVSQKPYPKLPISVNAGAIVVERRTGNVRAYVGSSDYLSESRRGGNNYPQALRSPNGLSLPISVFQ